MKYRQTFPRKGKIKWKNSRALSNPKIILKNIFMQEKIKKIHEAQKFPIPHLHNFSNGLVGSFPGSYLSKFIPPRKGKCTVIYL